MNPLLALAAPMLLAAAHPQEPVDAVSLAVARGAAAEAAGDGRAMLDAARTLEALGARPDSEGADLAKHWRALAQAQGVRDKAPPFRGRALGPAYRQGVLAPGASLATEQVFLAGQKAVVALVPEPARALNIRIQSRDRKNICERAAAAPRVSCAWLPLFTSRVEIRVVNQGPSSARYYLVSN
ncbi:hypothetical protein [Sphingomonas sp. M1-B02]|uniref:hypothetical protein n=1 Tax=Sphingomonas sp. M1-B02 TaxID=3114300 RepID=UPI0022404394|nr:hypothetical protein [Sphingomonas sp. S6-11]UZK67485.1 hypothetical protein OKW87_06545 [Sphingomonas sp. S6-11]